jgi:hypothetical protein
VPHQAGSPTHCPIPRSASSTKECCASLHRITYRQKSRHILSHILGFLAFQIWEAKEISQFLTASDGVRGMKEM